MKDNYNILIKLATIASNSPLRHLNAVFSVKYSVIIHYICNTAAEDGNHIGRPCTKMRHKLILLPLLVPIGTAARIPATAANPQKKSDTSKPNIVFMIADDCTYRDLGCYGGANTRREYSGKNRSGINRPFLTQLI